jgi:hypothetical protein
VDCPRCGLDIPGTKIVDGEPVWWDGDTITCADCKSVIRISVDDGDCYEDSDLGHAYVQGYTCKHGKDEEEPCPDCDAEDEAAATSGSGSTTHGA